MPVEAPTYVPKRIVQSMPTGTGDTTVYTVPGGAITIVKQIIVANVGTVSALASVSFVPNGVAVADGNRVCKDITIDPKKVVVFDLSQVMVTGDFISVKTSVASTLTYTISGVETTALAFPALGFEVADAGVIIGQRPRINFIEGANVTLTITDDPVNGEIDVLVAAPHTHPYGDLPGDIATDSEVAAAINAVIDAAPGALDTLNELAAALADDPNFATTMTTALAAKQNLSEKGQASGYAALDAGTKVPTAQLGGAGADATKFLRGDQTWQVVVSGGGGGETDPLVMMGGY